MSSAVGRPPAHKAVWQLSGSQTAAGCAGETLAPIGGAGTVQAMKEWLTPDQVCDQLGICRSSLYALWRAEQVRDIPRSDGCAGARRLAARLAPVV